MNNPNDITTQTSSVKLLEFMLNARLVDVRIAPIGVEKPFDGSDIIAQDGIWLELEKEEMGLAFHVPLLCPVCKNTIHVDGARLLEIEDMTGKCILGDIYTRNTIHFSARKLLTSDRNLCIREPNPTAQSVWYSSMNKIPMEGGLTPYTH